MKIKKYVFPTIFVVVFATAFYVLMSFANNNRVDDANNNLPVTGVKVDAKESALAEGFVKNFLSQAGTFGFSGTVSADSFGDTVKKIASTPREVKNYESRTDKYIHVRPLIFSGSEFWYKDSLVYSWPQFLTENTMLTGYSVDKDSVKIVIDSNKSVYKGEGADYQLKTTVSWVSKEKFYAQTGSDATWNGDIQEMSRETVFEKIPIILTVSGDKFYINSIGGMDGKNYTLCLWKNPTIEASLTKTPAKTGKVLHRNTPLPDPTPTLTPTPTVAPKTPDPTPTPTKTLIPPTDRPLTPEETNSILNPKNQ